MVWLTRFDGTRFLLNSDLIETVEAKPDTVITLTNGHHFVARESVEDIERQIVRFRRRTHATFAGPELTPLEGQEHAAFGGQE